MTTIYLDNNATTTIHPAVAEAISACYRQGYVNPASQHAGGRRARKRLEEARHGIADILGARVDTSRADRVVFTSGGTESNNLAIRGLTGRGLTGRGLTGRLPGHLIVSAIEHPSILATSLALQRSGCAMEYLPVDSSGVVRLSALESLISPDTQCVSVMLANHETGVLQPVKELVEICAPLGIRVHTDAVQAVGKLPVSFEDLGVDAMSVTAHKLHGPRGIGVLLLKHDVVIQPLIVGGSQQLGTRPGTECVALAVGMWRALQIWQEEARERMEHISGLRNQLQSMLAQEIPDMVVHGSAANRAPQTLNVSFPGLDRQALMMALDRGGIECSTGSACESGSSEPSPVLLAMGCAAEIVESSLRFSLSALSTAEEIDLASTRISQIVRQLKAYSHR